MEENGSMVHPNFLLVTYTSTQFPTPADVNELHQIAARATRDAGLPAFWACHSCMEAREHTEVR
jgi:hypothetical protein